MDDALEFRGRSSSRQPILENRRTKARDYINANSSIFEFLHDNGIKWNAHNSLSCMFHGLDEDPSMGISDDGKSFYCFGCQRSGGYIRFRTYYATIVEERKIGYNGIIEEILKSQPELCTMLGFSTIYSPIIADLAIERDETGRLVLPNMQRSRPYKVPTVTLRKIFDSLSNLDDLCAFIGLLQQGMREEQVISMYTTTVIGGPLIDRTALVEQLGDFTSLWDADDMGIPAD